MPVFQASPNGEEKLCSARKPVALIIFSLAGRLCTKAGLHFGAADLRPKLCRLTKPRLAYGVVKAHWGVCKHLQNNQCPDASLNAERSDWSANCGRLRQSERSLKAPLAFAVPTIVLQEPLLNDYRANAVTDHRIVPRYG
jgi:hypothetical protein